MEGPSPVNEATSALVLPALDTPPADSPVVPNVVGLRVILLLRGEVLFKMVILFLPPYSLFLRLNPNNMKEKFWRL